MYVNENIKNVKRVFPMQGRVSYLRHDMNENAGGGLPLEFVEEVKKFITPDFLSIYPEPDRFTQKYADKLGLDFENILATNGSDMAIRYLFETFGEVGKNVVTVAPSFEMYWVNCNILGYRHIPVQYEDDWSIDTNKIIETITPDTRIVVLLNPNNPMGNVYSNQEAEAIIRRASKFDSLVIIDEAYYQFCGNTFIDFIQKYNNVAILRTFSKLFSLAACRLGVIIGSKEIIHYVKNAKLTFDVNSIALLFGELLLDHPKIEKQLIDEEKEGKEYVLNQLNSKGYECKKCNGNFIFVKPKHEPFELAKRLQNKGVLVKTFSNNLLKNYFRINTSGKDAMNKFLNIFLEEDS